MWSCGRYLALSCSAIWKYRTKVGLPTAGGSTPRLEVGLPTAGCSKSGTQQPRARRSSSNSRLGQPGLDGQAPTAGPHRSTKLYPLVESDTRAVEALQRVGKFIERTAEISGEVRFPGTYPILKGERLSSVLQRAGGFTKNAYLRGAVFTRIRAREEQEKRLQELIREQELTLIAQSATGAQTALNADEVQAQRQSVEQQRLLLERLKAVQPEGRLVVRLESLETFAGSVQDIELDAGDRLLIPAVPKYINVLGEVYNRTALIYEPKRTIGYYLDKVGGLRPDAEADQVYLVQIDGTVISNSAKPVCYRAGEWPDRCASRTSLVSSRSRGTPLSCRVASSTAATLRNVRDIVQIIFQSVSTLGVIAALLTAL